MKNKIVMLAAVISVLILLSSYLSFFSERFSLKSIRVSNYAESVVLKPYRPLSPYSIVYELSGKADLGFVCHTSYLFSCIMVADSKGKIQYLLSTHKEIPSALVTLNEAKLITGSGDSTRKQESE